MKIAVTGTRGIPDILGGVETHCEALYPLLAAMGVEVKLIRRTAYIDGTNRLENYKGIKLVDLFSPRKKSIEAIVHTVLAVLYARIKGFKYIHVHSVGPSLVIPLARLLGLKVVMTHHGPDYDRQKWGKAAKLMLKAGEWCAARFANEIIVISETINSILKEKYHRHNAHLIYNGVNIPTPAATDKYISSLGLKTGEYLIAVGRFVPEKGLHDLIEAYTLSGISQKLVLVGDADHETDYSLEIKKKAIKKGIVLTGFIKGEKLNEIYTHAGLFVLPSYHEGLPIALLEAMSYNLRVLVSDIPANLEVNIDKSCYFQVGNVQSLSEKIKKAIQNPVMVDYIQLLQQKYNWETIAGQTYEVYSKLEKN